MPIKRAKKYGFVETGVVSAISYPLKQFSLLYLSSFKTGYVLVKQVELDQVKLKLEEKGFEVIQSIL